MISGFRNLQNMEAALDLHKRMMRGLLVIYRFTQRWFRDCSKGKLIFASDLYAEMLAKGIYHA
jgi:hypothetical protein